MYGLLRRLLLLDGQRKRQCFLSKRRLNIIFLQLAKMNSSALPMVALPTCRMCLSLSWRRLLSYRNQSIDLQSKSMDWFLCDNGLRPERVNSLNLNRSKPKRWYVFYLNVLTSLSKKLFNWKWLSLVFHLLILTTK